MRIISSHQFVTEGVTLLEITAARTVLAIMIAQLMGAPAFVTRILPVYTLTAEFLCEQIHKVIEIVHSCSGFCFTMSDNYVANQKCFSIFKHNFGSSNIYSSKYPVENAEFDLLFLMHDPVYLLKNIRNNLHTEKLQILQFDGPDTGKGIKPKWKDFTIYEK